MRPECADCDIPRNWVKENVMVGRADKTGMDEE